MSSLDEEEPNLEKGLQYWENTPATLNGVLGGFGTGTLPRVDPLGSRQFAQSLLPYTVRIKSVLRPLAADDDSKPPLRRIRALDVGAGIGRVTANVLLHLVDDVVMVEPIPKFVEQAVNTAEKWNGISGKEKSVTFLTGPLQRFDPRKTVKENGEEFMPRRMGWTPPPTEENESGYDIVWCQWALGHLSDADLVTFFKQARESLRKSPTGRAQEDGLVVVKENVCRDSHDGEPAVVFDYDDSSVTRSNLKWLQIFKEAGLTLVRDKVQEGLPDGLFEVRMYALR